MVTSESRINSIDKYIADTPLPTIDPVVAQELENPFTAEELNQAIKDMAPGKSPGPDGYTTNFYKTLKQHLVPFLLPAFNSTTPFPTQTLEALITVIPKPGKDNAHCTNFRPISLLNLDLKLYSKLIANRIQPLMPTIIHGDQVGFIQGRQARDNIPH